HAMTNMDGQGIDLWDPEDKFFYDVVLMTDGSTHALKIHSMVGLVPLFAVLTAEPDRFAGLDLFVERAGWFLKHRPDLLRNVAPVAIPGANNSRLMAILTRERLTDVLHRMLDPANFLSDYGIRSLSRYHLEHPFELKVDGHDFIVKYLPAESDSR